MCGKSARENSETKVVGSKAVWTFSGNSSILVIISAPKICPADDLDKLTMWTRAFFEVKISVEIRNK